MEKSEVHTDIGEEIHIFVEQEIHIDLLTREIEDPEKQRKMEERENRREKKKAQPKMKQLKVN